MMYSWASPDYILDEMSLEQAMMYYEKGVKGIELQAKVFWSVLGKAMDQKQEQENPETLVGDEPDLAKFRAIYGNAIKRGA
jgi:hypothetical protein